jgi:hypothetical protein
MSGNYQQPPPQGNQQNPPPGGQPYQHPPGQYPSPSSGKKGPGKTILIILVVAIVIFSFIAMALLMSPGIVGKWEQVSTRTTVTILGNQITSWDNSTGDWVEFRKDGTGTTNDGGEFGWEIDDDQLKFSGDFLGGTISYTFYYTLKGKELTMRGNLAPGVYVVITYNRA